MDTIPTLTLAPAHPAQQPSATTAAARVVDPAERTGCAWYVVTSPEPAGQAAPHPHAA